MTSNPHRLPGSHPSDMGLVEGIAGEYAELLESAGVDTMKELRNRNAANLTEKLAEVDSQHDHTRRLRTEKASTAGSRRPGPCLRGSSAGRRLKQPS